MAELVDALDLGSSKLSFGGSSPPNRNKKLRSRFKNNLFSNVKNIEYFTVFPYFYKTFFYCFFLIKINPTLFLGFD